jgi:hypothetical protein
LPRDRGSPSSGCRRTRQLNNIERSWRDLKRHYLAHRTFRGADDLDAALHHTVVALNAERRAPACAVVTEAA